MPRVAIRIAQTTLIAILVSGVASEAATAGDLSKYRNFQLGADLPAIAKQARRNESEAKLIHRRPALIQDLEWRAPLTSADAPKDLVFTFYNGQLFRIVITYDLHDTRGLTSQDMIEAVSETYGTAAQPTAAPKFTQGRYGDEVEFLARWEDANYRFDLVRSSYGGRFSLAGVLKRLEQPVQIAIEEAASLDLSEAPQRELERKAKQVESERAKLEKARLANKPKFRP